MSSSSLAAWRVSLFSHQRRAVMDAVPVGTPPEGDRVAGTSLQGGQGWEGARRPSHQCKPEVPALSPPSHHTRHPQEPIDLGRRDNTTRPDS